MQVLKNMKRKSKKYWQNKIFIFYKKKLSSILLSKNKIINSKKKQLF